MGILGHLNGQPLEPEMEAFWSLMLLPMVPNVTLSGYGFVSFASPEVANSGSCLNIDSALFPVVSRKSFPEREGTLVMGKLPSMVRVKLLINSVSASDPLRDRLRGLVRRYLDDNVRLLESDYQPM
jgi:hypothetical protein